ncbi:hypothetical protein RB599_010290 [Gaeumannomyces hyphopodioides]
MHITVAPASTKAGRATIEALLADSAGPTVTGVYRNLSRVPAQFSPNPNFKAMQGDVQDGASLDFSGADAVLAITPPQFHESDIVADARKMSENMKAAAQKAGIKRLVLLSSVGAELEKGTVSRIPLGRVRQGRPDDVLYTCAEKLSCSPGGAQGEILTNHAAEQVFEGTAPEVVYVRCAYFMENWMMSLETVHQEPPFFYTTITPLDFKVPMIAVKDIGSTLAAQLLATGSAPPANPHVFELWGPEDYSSLDTQAAFAAAAGRDVEVRPVPKDGLGDFFVQAGLPPSVAKEWAEMSACFLPGGVIEADVSRTEGVVRGKTTLHEAVKEMYNLPPAA